MTPNQAPQPTDFTDPVTGLLYNSVGAKNQDHLDRIEHDVSITRFHELRHPQSAAPTPNVPFGMATGEGHNRAAVIGQQLWEGSTLLGDATLPAHRILLAIQSGTATKLEMDELTYLLESVVSQAGDQAEVVFGHGLNPALGESIQVMMLVSRQ